MDHSQAAQFLHVSLATLERWVRQGLLPPPLDPENGYGSLELGSWAKARGLPHGTAISKGGAHNVSITSALNRGSTLYGVQANNSYDAINAIIDQLDQFSAPQRQEILTKVLDRERMASTAVGHGVALPHPREAPGHLVQEPILTVAFFSKPLDWAAPDNQPVHTAFLLLSPNAHVHLKLLARIARLLKTPDCGATLSAIPEKPELLTFIERHEQENPF